MPCASWQTGSHHLTFPPRPAILKGHKRGDPLTQVYYIRQRQPHTEEIETLWESYSEQQAEDAAGMVNSNLASAGIPSEYYSFVTT